MDRIDSPKGHPNEAATDEPASNFNPAQAEREGAGIPGFDPVSVRHRIDGWTPERQREYVEALADTGIARHAAARVGMSEQSAARLRRRPDARAFDLACEAALRIGARRLRSVAYDRAIEGVARPRYWRGEVVGEERVYDNRLLIYLLGRTEKLAAPPAEAAMVARGWHGWVEALGLGAPPPHPEQDAPVSNSEELWEEDGIWWTSFPPPAGFDGEEEEEPGDPDYCRTLTPREQAVLDARLERERAAEAARRDSWFGFEGGVSTPPSAAPSEPFEPSAPPDPPAEPEAPAGRREASGGRAPPRIVAL